MTEKLKQLLAGQTLMIGGHRGMSERYPENTLPAVIHAAELGVDLIEIDIYLSKDDIPVLAHDQNLERCSNGTGLVYEKTLEELKQLDFGGFKGKAFEGTRLPTLEEFFQVMLGYPDVLIDVDIKIYPDDIRCAHKAVDLAERMGILDRCIFNSIDCDVVDALYHRVGRRIVGAPDFYPWIKNFRPGPEGTFSQLWGVCVPYKNLTPEVADRFRSYGLTVVCTPADTEEEVLHALECGVKLPLCNAPEAFLCHVGRLERADDLGESGLGM